MTSKARVRVLVIHGPNLNLLGSRDPAIYGRQTLADIDRLLAEQAATHGAEVKSFQTNLEGEIVTAIQNAALDSDAVVLNPAGYTHTSVAIRDAIEACGVPVIEVHLSNIHARESFRAASVTAAKCIGQISGFGAQSYVLGLYAAIAHVKGLAARRKDPPAAATDKEP